MEKLISFLNLLETDLLTNGRAIFLLTILIKLFNSGKR